MVILAERELLLVSVPPLLRVIAAVIDPVLVTAYPLLIVIAVPIVPLLYILLAAEYTKVALQVIPELIQSVPPLRVMVPV